MYSSKGLKAKKLKSKLEFIIIIIIIIIIIGVVVVVVDIVMWPIGGVASVTEI